MKILMLNNYFHVNSGASRVMLDEAEILTQKGHEVHFFTTDKKPFFDETYTGIKYFPKYIKYRELNKISLLKNIFRPFYNFESEHKLDDFLKVLKPDIVHKHSVSRHLTASVLNACYKNKIPAVMTIHGPTFFCPQEGFMLNEKTYCTKELCSRNNFLPFLKYNCLNQSLPQNLYLAGLYTIYKSLGIHNGIKKFICPSFAMKEVALRAKIPAENLEVIYNTSSIKNFSTLPQYSQGNYFLYAGRLDRVKGVHFLLQAMEILPREINLRIAGDGFERDNLENTIQKLNLSNVVLVGYKSGKDLEAEYKNCIATILPCNYFETFGLAVTESFLAGKTVIASNIGGIPEIVDSGINGILVEPGNVKQLADAIFALYKNPELAQMYAKEGRKKTELLFNTELHYQNLINVYEKVI